jgi:hypothetical protein
MWENVEALEQSWTEGTVWMVAVANVANHIKTKNDMQ